MKIQSILEYRPGKNTLCEIYRQIIYKGVSHTKKDTSSYDKKKFLGQLSLTV